MANFSKTVTNSVRCFGGGPSTKWGQANGYPYTMTWGTSKWGEGESLPIAFKKVISNSQNLTFDYYGSRQQKRFEIGSMAANFTAASQTLRQGQWFYIFTSDTYLASQRDYASWTSASPSDATFTCQAAAGITWSSGR